jgi:hypothetical protein
MPTESASLTKIITIFNSDLLYKCAGQPVFEAKVDVQEDSARRGYNLRTQLSIAQSERPLTAQTKMLPAVAHRTLRQTSSVAE